MLNFNNLRNIFVFIWAFSLTVKKKYQRRKWLLLTNTAASQANFSNRLHKHLQSVDILHHQYEANANKNRMKALKVVHF